MKGKRFKHTEVDFTCLPSEVVLYKILPYYRHVEKAIDTYKKTDCLRFYGKFKVFDDIQIVKLFEHVLVKSNNMDIQNLCLVGKFPNSLKSFNFVLDSMEICNLPTFLDIGQLNKYTDYDKFIYKRRFGGDLFCRVFVSDFPDPTNDKIKYTTKEFSCGRDFFIKKLKDQKGKKKNLVSIIGKNLVARIHKDGKNIHEIDINVKDFYKRAKTLRTHQLVCVKIGVDKTELFSVNLLALLKQNPKIYDHSFFYGDGTLTYC